MPMMIVIPIATPEIAVSLSIRLKASHYLVQPVEYICYAITPLWYLKRAEYHEY
jgi:hypothetical protein